jgi:hypothetical protein
VRRRARTLAQGVAVHDGGDVAEEVLAAVGLRWGKNASFRRSRDRYVIRTRNLQDWNLTRYRCANRSMFTCMHPVGFEPTPPKRLGLKSNALDQLGHRYKWAAWNSCDDGGVRTHARRLVPKTSASGRSQELRPLGHIINVRDSDRVRTRIDLGQRIDPATLTGVDFKSTALTTRPHYLATKSRYRGETDAGVEPATFR